MEENKIKDLVEEFATKQELKLTKQALKVIVQQVKSELKLEMDKREWALRAEIEQAKVDLLKWFACLLLGSTLVVSVILWLFNLFG
jgi:hypothetical protein